MEGQNHESRNVKFQHFHVSREKNMPKRYGQSHFTRYPLPASLKNTLFQIRTERGGSRIANLKIAHFCKK